MKATLNQVVKAFQDIADAHLQVNTFGFGPIEELDANASVVYPLVWLSPLPGSIEGKVSVLAFEMLIADVVHTDNANLTEVWSDALLIGTDILAQLRTPEYQEQFTIDQNASYEPTQAYGSDNVAGHVFNIRIKVPYDWSRCDRPSTL